MPIAAIVASTVAITEAMLAMMHVKLRLPLKGERTRTRIWARVKSGL